jgi:hypothetical protein
MLAFGFSLVQGFLCLFPAHICFSGRYHPVKQTAVHVAEVQYRIGTEPTLQKMLLGWVEPGQQALMSCRMEAVSGSAKRVSA